MFSTFGMGGFSIYTLNTRYNNPMDSEKEIIKPFWNFQRGERLYILRMSMKFGLRRRGLTKAKLTKATKKLIR